MPDIRDGTRRSLRRPPSIVWLAVAAASLSALPDADARITRLEITSIQSPAFGGQSFGSVGQYETLVGRAWGEVDPDDSRNAVITDIHAAPRNARGMVEYSMDVFINKPIDMSRGNGTTLHDVPNRGRVRSLEINIGGSGTTNAGDGFLQSQGYTLVDNGWEHDLTTGLRISLPVARNSDGSAITGPVRAEYILDEETSTVEITAPPEYESVTTNNAGATMTRRVHQHDPKELVPNAAWAFADCSVVPFPGVPDPTRVCLQGGFDTNHIYELVYTSRNPPVVGLGFAATRDLAAFLRNSRDFRGAGNCKPSNARGKARGHDKCDAQPHPDNPLGDWIEHSIVYGSSQSGRWIRTFIQLGFNEDENGNPVFDGAIPHKASNRGAFNVRFAQPTRLSGTQHTEAQYPGGESPQSWGVSHDPLSSVTAGQLDRCRRSHTCPKIFHTNTDTEYWEATMALNTTDAFGTRDLPIPPDVRIYLFAATQHGGGNALAQPPAVLPGFPAACQLRSNSNPFIHGQRALLVALHEWIVDKRSPPPSLYPTIRAGTLVPVGQIHYPYVPASAFSPAGVALQKFYLDRGPLFNVADISGVMSEPPAPGAAYPVLMPQVDADGNTLDGLRNTNVEAPLGTYVGWNVRKAGFSEGDSCDLTGAFIPFARTLAERLAAGDPRPSLQERYPTHQDYVARIAAAAGSLVERRLLLPQDAAQIISQANAAAVP
jgi:hypothetical protein